MPDNPEGAPPLTMDEAVKALAPEEGQAAGASAEPAPPKTPTPAPDKEPQVPPSGMDAKALGFASEAELAKAYSEQRSEKNRRDKELSAGRKAQDELQGFKSLLGINEAPSPTAPASTAPVASPAPAPSNVPVTMNDAEMATLREALGDDVVRGLENVVERRVSERVGKVEEQLNAEKKAEHDRWLANRLNEVETEIKDLIGNVGEEEYNRVMNNPESKAAIAELTIIQGLSVTAAYRAYREDMALKRGSADGSAPIGNPEGGSLPPGGQPGGTQPRTPTKEESEVAAMRTALDDMNDDFFQRGLEKK